MMANSDINTIMINRSRKGRDDAKYNDTVIRTGSRPLCNEQVSNVCP